jgi:hypothetical protein
MVLRRQPVVIQTLVMAIVNLFIAFNIITLDATKIGAINVALAAVLGFFTSRAVTPLVDPRDNFGNKLVAAPK